MLVKTMLCPWGISSAAYPCKMQMLLLYESSNSNTKDMLITRVCFRDALNTSLSI